MISLELIRADPDRVRRAMETRGEQVPVDRILELDAQRRSAIVKADNLRARRNAVSKQLGQSKERPLELIEEMREVGGQIKVIEEEARASEVEMETLLLTVRVCRRPGTSMPAT